MVFGRCWRAATRRWHSDQNSDEPDSTNFHIFRKSSKRTQLSACVTGLSGSLGVGVWVICIEISRLAAGPAALVSFLLAMIASVLAAFCYVEFMSRLKSCGSAFSFVYYSVGELPAFVIGWTLVMDYTIGAAVATRSFSHHLDTLVDGMFSQAFRQFAPIRVENFAEYFDFMSVGIILVLGCFMLITNQSTLIMSGIFTCIGLVAVLIVIIAGVINADANNWDISIQNSTSQSSTIFPYCCKDTVRATAPALYILVAAVGALGGAPNGKDPRASVRGGAIALVILSCLCTAVIAVVSLSQPNYILNSTLPISEIFYLSRWDVYGIIINIGGMLCLLVSTFPAINLSSDILCDMARDKLVPVILAGRKKRHKVSFQSKLISIIIAACFTGLFDVQMLLSMLSVGIILAYLFCSVGIIIFRYEKSEKLPRNDIHDEDSNEFCGGFLRFIKFVETTRSTIFTANIVNFLTIIYCLSCVVFAFSIIYMSVNEILTVAFLAVSGTIGIVCIILIASQPTKVNIRRGFIVPLVPVLPCFNILLLIFIAVALDVIAWIRFGIWLALGALLYFICLYFYGRGAKNIEITDKKFQNNGHIKGNLNRAFSISSENKFSIVSTTITKENNSTSSASEILSSELSNNHVNNEVSIKPRLSKILKDQDLIVPEGDLLQNLDTNNIKTNSYFVMSSAPTTQNAQEKVPESDEISIIEMFEQMLATVEVPLESNDKNDDITASSIKTDDLVSSDETDEEIDDNKSDKFKYGSNASSYKLTEYNVVALVHREEKRLSANTDESKSFSSQLNEIESNNNNNIYTYSVLNENEAEQKIESQTIEDQISVNEEEEITSVIPTPPPIDEEFFAKSSYKSTASSKIRMPLTIAPYEEKIDDQRVSVAMDEPNNYDPVFGSKNQTTFMDRLNSLLQTQVMAQPTESQTVKLNRSYSSDHVTNFSKTHKPHHLENLPKEVKRKVLDETQEILKNDTEIEPEIRRRRSSTVVLSKDQIKSKLESIFSSGGNFLLGPKCLAKAAEENNSDENKQEDNSLTSKENNLNMNDVKKLENMSKLDTLQRQRAKFGDVLNAFRMSHVVKDPDEDYDKTDSDKAETTTTASDHNLLLF